MARGHTERFPSVTQKGLRPPCKYPIVSNDKLTSHEQLAVTQKGFLTEVSGTDINASHINIVKRHVNVSRTTSCHRKVSRARRVEQTLTRHTSTVSSYILTCHERLTVAQKNVLPPRCNPERGEWNRHYQAGWHFPLAIPCAGVAAHLAAACHSPYSARILSCVAVCGSVLQCVAVCCSVLQSYSARILSAALGVTCHMRCHM